MRVCVILVDLKNLVNVSSQTANCKLRNSPLHVPVASELFQMKSERELHLALRWMLSVCAFAHAQKRNKCALATIVAHTHSVGSKERNTCERGSASC